MSLRGSLQGKRFTSVVWSVKTRPFFLSTHLSQGDEVLHSRAALHPWPHQGKQRVHAVFSCSTHSLPVT